MAITPQAPIVNAGLLYINGLNLSNDATTPETLLNISAGACRDSSNVNDIVVSSAQVLNIAALGALGLDVGTVAASTLYAVYAIGSSTNQIGNGQPNSDFPGTVIMSASFVQPVLPQNYDMYRRIGAIRTDSSSEILKFYQVGSGAERHMWYDEAIATTVTADNVAVFTAFSLAGITPAIKTDVDLYVTSNASVALRYTGSASTIGQATLYSAVALTDVSAVLVCPQSAACSIDYLTEGASTATVLVAGYVDQL